ncbi:efflux RND transporter periplasmic adaptor subunit [Neopoerus faecalis]|uniref:efflux RND transporter periplasmic adaptor subunit n=1 Tax=Neopoerus faecalis TaxID=3032125 RepID=UPI00256FF739|nr:HlyD family efflux transporter periplasmic adaptor subunit [Neopoerus faecalis]
MEEMMKDTQAAQSAAQPTAGAQAEKKPRFSLPKSKKGKKWLKILIAVAVVAAIAVGCVANAAKKANSQIAGGYLVAQAVRQDLVLSVTGTATLKPADSYNVTTLLSGTIEDAPFEEDDQVEKGDLLFAMDSSDAQNRVDQASISVSQAKIAYQQASEAANPTATISGTINELYVHNGDSVSMGSPIAKLISSRDLTVDFLFPYAKPTDFYVGQPASVYVGNFDAPVDGTVESVSNETTLTSNGMNSVSVRVKITNPGGISDAYTASARIGAYASYGQTSINMGGSTTVYASGSGTIQNLSKLAGSTVKQGEVLCTVSSETVRDQLQNARLNLQNAELAASMAADSLDDYNITSQITGRVIEKNFKAGDKVEGMNSGSLAVIYDMSYLKLELAVDELDIGKVAVGQSVSITADALEGQTFTGVVDKVSINGTTSGGATSYPVTIVIENYGELKPGMNVSATIQGDQIPNALCIPVDAVNRGNTVTVPGPGAMNADGTAVVDISKLETKEVTLGKSDGDYIEVTGGLEEGDTVLIANQSSSMMNMVMGM